MAWWRIQGQLRDICLRKTESQYMVWCCKEDMCLSFLLKNTYSYFKQLLCNNIKIRSFIWLWCWICIKFKMKLGWADFILYCAVCPEQFAVIYINKIQKDATLCRYLFTAKSLSTCFGCPSHPSSGEHKTVTAASGTATTFLQGGLIGPRWRKIVAQILLPVPEAAVTILYSPDDGCDGHPQPVENDFSVTKYPHFFASCWILLI